MVHKKYLLLIVWHLICWLFVANQASTLYGHRLKRSAQYDYEKVDNSLIASNPSDGEFDSSQSTSGEINNSESAESPSTNSDNADMHRSGDARNKTKSEKPVPKMRNKAINQIKDRISEILVNLNDGKNISAIKKGIISIKMRNGEPTPQVSDVKERTERDDDKNKMIDGTDRDAVNVGNKSVRNDYRHNQTNSDPNERTDADRDNDDTDAALKMNYEFDELDADIVETNSDDDNEYVADKHNDASDAQSGAPNDAKPASNGQTRKVDNKNQNQNQNSMNEVLTMLKRDSTQSGPTDNSSKIRDKPDARLTNDKLRENIIISSKESETRENSLPGVRVINWTDSTETSTSDISLETTTYLMSNSEILADIDQMCANWMQTRSGDSGGNKRASIKPKNNIAIDGKQTPKPVKNNRNDRYSEPIDSSQPSNDVSVKRPKNKLKSQKVVLFYETETEKPVSSDRSKTTTVSKPKDKIKQSRDYKEREDPLRGDANVESPDRDSGLQHSNVDQSQPQHNNMGDKVEPKRRIQPQDMKSIIKRLRPTDEQQSTAGKPFRKQLEGQPMDTNQDTTEGQPTVEPSQTSPDFEDDIKGKLKTKKPAEYEGNVKNVENDDPLPKRQPKRSAQSKQFNSEQWLASETPAEANSGRENVRQIGGSNAKPNKANKITSTYYISPEDSRVNAKPKRKPKKTQTVISYESEDESRTDSPKERATKMKAKQTRLEKHYDSSDSTTPQSDSIKKEIIPNKKKLSFSKSKPSKKSKTTKPSKSRKNSRYIAPKRETDSSSDNNDYEYDHKFAISDYVEPRYKEEAKIVDLDEDFSRVMASHFTASPRKAHYKKSEKVDECVDYDE